MLNTFDAISFINLYITAYKLVWSDPSFTNITCILQKIESCAELTEAQKVIHINTHHAIKQGGSRQSVAEYILAAMNLFTTETADALNR